MPTHLQTPRHPDAIARLYDDLHALEFFKPHAERRPSVMHQSTADRCGTGPSAAEEVKQLARCERDGAARLVRQVRRHCWRRLLARVDAFFYSRRTFQHWN